MKDAEKWMGDAVRVLPPEGHEPRHVGTSWDGSDWYSFSTSTAPTTSSKGGAVSQANGKEQQPRLTTPALAMAGSRKEALLRRLREDEELLLVDPEGEGESQERKEAFKTWVDVTWHAANTAGRATEEEHVGPIRMALGERH